MYYRGYYIETDGESFRAYRKILIFKKYLSFSVENGSMPVCSPSLDKMKRNIDARLALKQFRGKKWELVDPLYLMINTEK